MPNFTTSTMKQFADAPECERKFAPELRPHELIHNAIAEKAKAGVKAIKKKSKKSRRKKKASKVKKKAPRKKRRGKKKKKKRS